MVVVWCGVVIGIIVDAIWEWIDDPAGDIEREMIIALDNLSHNAASAITAEMNEVISKRGELWDHIVKEISP